MHSENSPPWRGLILVAATVIFFILDAQFVLELLARGYDLRTTLTAAGLLSVTAAEFAFRLVSSPLPPNAGPKGPFPA